MKRKTLFLLITALLSRTGAGAQSTAPPPAQQPAKPYSTLDDDPQFKNLTPEQQDLVRKMMGGVDKAIAAEQSKAGTLPPAAVKPQQPIPRDPAPSKTAAPNNVPSANTLAPSGCSTLPIKKPKFHLPKPIQDAVNKTTKRIAGNTGVDLDPNAAAQTVNNAQKNIPCPPAPAQPVSTPANK